VGRSSTVAAMERLGRLARTYALDILIVLAAAEAMLEVAFRDDETRAPTSPLWFALPATGLLILPLLARRRYPFGAPAALWVLGATVSFVDGRLIVFTTTASLAGAVAAFLLGNLPDETQARVGLGITFAGSALIVYNDPNHTSGELVFIPALFVVAWLAGAAVRSRTQEAEAAEVRATRAEEERETAARLAVAEERTRIARELHDIVAHAVSVMVLQVGAVRRSLPDELAADRETLTDVERAGREALGEMRRLLGAMRRAGDDAELAPQPGLDRVDSLVDEICRTGLPVELHVEGARFPLPPAVDLSAYRIVQEGLTNVLKHAHASHADVVLRYDPGELRIEVRNDGTSRGAGDGLGHGLVGVRERVKIYGGEMTAGPAADGGFVLSASLPVEDGGR
jgi:signal transduction histidine kinase